MPSKPTFSLQVTLVNYIPTQYFANTVQYSLYDRILEYIKNYKNMKIDIKCATGLIDWKVGMRDHFGFFIFLVYYSDNHHRKEWYNYTKRVRGR